jgi:16S rRNA processing protein RimM
MRKDECYELGFFSKPHGLQGELALILDVDYPEQYKNLKTILVEKKGSLVPYFVDRISILPDRALVKLEEVKTDAEAMALKGAKVFLPLSDLPALGHGQFYYHELIGYTVRDVASGWEGTVQSIIEMPHQELIQALDKGKEVLIPYTKDIVQDPDRESKIILVHLPEGLLDVYLNESDETEEVEPDATSDEVLLEEAYKKLRP